VCETLPARKYPPFNLLKVLRVYITVVAIDAVGFEETTKI
jgi:hypothetical protein